MPLPWFCFRIREVAFRSFSTSLVRASSSTEVRREAGENPALPRNCKRGNSQPVTGLALGRPAAFIGQ